MSSSSEDDVIANVPDEDEDLFGDDDELQVEKTRELSDKELDSGDDEDRNDRAPKGDVEIYDDSGRDARIMEQIIFGHPVPKPADGELNTLRLPKFLGIAPLPYDPSTFSPPTSDHHTETKSANFSASAVAASTIRYRKNPSMGKFESNTIMYKWSDGSTTISVGDQHYELQTKPLAPPADSKTYLDVQDSHQYLASPSLSAQLLVTVGHLANQYTVRPNKDIEDDALEKLQKSLAAAARGNHKGDDKGGPELITNTQDPELQKKRAEIAEKERLRAQRRRETIAEKQSLPRNPPIRSSGLRLDDIERRANASGRKPKRRPRRDDYDSDDEPRKYKEDEYDMDDGFLASSGEEIEEGDADDDDDDDEMIDDESERDEPKAKKPKVSKPEEISDADADAEADLDDEDAPAIPITTEPVNRGRKRHVIEDDDDDE